MGQGFTGSNPLLNWLWWVAQIWLLTTMSMTVLDSPPFTLTHAQCIDKIFLQMWIINNSFNNNNNLILHLSLKLHRRRMEDKKINPGQKSILTPAWQLETVLFYTKISHLYIPCLWNTVTKGCMYSIFYLECGDNSCELQWWNSYFIHPGTTKTTGLFLFPLPIVVRWQFSAEDFSLICSLWNFFFIIQRNLNVFSCILRCPKHPLLNNLVPTTVHQTSLWLFSFSYHSFKLDLLRLMKVKDCEER